MIRRSIVLILFLALSSPPLVTASVDGMCMTAKSLAPSKMPAQNAHACCATQEAPETCATGTLAMSCCSLDPAPYREAGMGALPPVSPAQLDQLDYSTPLRGFHLVEPVIHVSTISTEMDSSRSPPPLRALFCTYLI